METIKLIVSGMTCGACVKHVEKVVHSIAGVQKTEVDLASGVVKVEGDVSQHIKEMIAALEESGYSAQVSTDLSSKVKSSSCRSISSCCCN
jgi:copper chaperone CopZ